MHGGICIKENWEKGEMIEMQDRTDKKMKATEGTDRFENKTKIVKLVICNCTLKKSDRERDG
jgi:hypothetical protein